MPSIFIEPFDFKKLLVDFFIGDANLFALFFVIFYSFAAAHFGFSNRLYFFFLVIGTVLFSFWVGIEIYAIIILLFGGFVFRALAGYIF